jgi:hypothetical protein
MSKRYLRDCTIALSTYTIALNNRVTITFKLVLSRLEFWKTPLDMKRNNNKTYIQSKKAHFDIFYT